MKLVKMMVCAVMVMMAAAAVSAEENAPVADFSDVAAALRAAGSSEAALTAAEASADRLKSYADYEQYVASLRGILQNEPNTPRANAVNYLIAEARLAELKFLSARNDIESGRLYMQVNEQYFNEALECLDKASADKSDKGLILNVYFQKFVIFKEKFQSQRSDAIFEELVKAIAAYGQSPEENKAALDRIAGMFRAAGMTDYALKLNVAYAQKMTDPAAAALAVQGIKETADLSFAQGKIKEADATYEQYLAIAEGRAEGARLAASIMEIGDKYFSVGQYQKAFKYYGLYLAKYGTEKMADYCAYKSALCLARTKENDKAAAAFAAFLDTYPNSIWFDRAYENLSKLYYVNPSPDVAIEELSGLIGTYYRKNAGDYAVILRALLLAVKKQYDEALASLKKVDPQSIYSYAAVSLAKDIEETKKGTAPSYFDFEDKDTYKMWEPYTPTNVKIVPTVESGDAIGDLFKNVLTRKERPAETTVSPGAEEAKTEIIQVAAKPGDKITFKLDGLADVDRFSDYLQDRDDVSRLPKKIREGRGSDLMSLEWSSDAGAFLDDKQTDVKAWQAPKEPGVYKIFIATDDFGMIRPPHKGTRKDSAKNLTIVVTVAQ